MKSVTGFNVLVITFGLACVLWLSVNYSADDIVIESVSTNVLLPDTLSKNAQIGKLALKLNVHFVMGRMQQGKTALYHH